MITLADLTDDQVDVLCNGCGPAGWKKHSWKWRVARWLTPKLDRACKQHDLAYTAGGSEAHRVAADHAFREAIAAVARESGWLVGWLLEQEQPILFDIVELEGRAHFGYTKTGEPRTLDQVIALADARLRTAEAA